MNTIKNFVTKAQTKVMMLGAGVKTEEPKTEKGDHLIEVLGVIIISVALLALFKERITSIFNNSLNSTSNSMGDLFK